MGDVMNTHQIASDKSWEVWQRQQDERNGVVAAKTTVPKVKATAEKPARFDAYAVVSK